MNRKSSRISDDVRAFERAISRKPVDGRYLLSLFVTGSTPRSVRAIQNIRAFCEARLHGRYELKVIDIYQHPERIKAEQIVATPTLVKKMPLPMRRLIGDLSNKDRLLVGLDVAIEEAAL